MMSVSAQTLKFAFVDSEYILNNIPAYKSAQAQLDKLSAD
jgi:Skp family chaperone for outer membrane proteins